MNEIYGVQASYTEPRNLCAPAFIVSTYKTWEEACEAVRNLDPQTIFDAEGPRCEKENYHESYQVKEKMDMWMNKHEIPWFTMDVQLTCGLDNELYSVDRRYSVRPVEIPLP